MPERSQFWTTGTSGDGAAAITEAQTTEFFMDLWSTDQEATEGVLAGVDSQLAVTGSSSPVSVASGAAIVEGYYYKNTSTVSVTIPTPSVATRIDRIVLRADHSAKTVRVTRIAGVEGGGAPAITQVAGTTWDIKLAQVSITTGGVITVTDERDYCHLAIAPIYRRQGGSATDWSIHGTTTYIPGVARKQIGIAQWTGASASTGTLVITFPVAFSEVPHVMTCSNGGDVHIAVQAITTTTFTADWKSIGGFGYTGGILIRWTAEGTL